MKYKIRIVGESLILPIVRAPLAEERGKLQEVIGPFEIVQNQFEERIIQSNSLRKELGISQHINLPVSYDVVGDIAILELDSGLAIDEKQVGEAFMKVHPNVHAVFSKAGPILGSDRIRPLRHIAGENRTETVHKEYGCIYHMDLSKVFFSPRLSTEHARVAEQVRKGEIVTDMFAGVGPFSILIAKKTDNVQVNSIDANPIAIDYLTKNVRLNKVQDKVRVWGGDAKKIVSENLTGSSTRIIMNHPSESSNFVAAAINGFSQQGGIIHYYTFSKDDVPMDSTRKQFIDTVGRNGGHVIEILEMRQVREVSPFTWQVVIDAEISKD